jgi:RNA polymerase sigma factor (sigma-70 family)
MSSAEVGYEGGLEPVSPPPHLRLVGTTPDDQAMVAMETPVALCDQPDQDEQLTDFQLHLVSDHLDMIPGAIAWARRRRESGLDVEHAAGDAAIGLCRAARRFDPTMQVTFRTFAVHAVRGEIIDGERRFHKLGGLDRHQARSPSQLNNSRTRSLDAPLVTGTNFSLLDVIPADEPATDKVAIDEVQQGRFYDSLPVTDRQKLVYYLKARKYTLQEIGALTNISPRTVSREFKAVVAALFAAIQPDLFE